MGSAPLCPVCLLMEEGGGEEYAHDDWPTPQRFLVLRVPCSMVLHFRTICWYCCLQKDREDLCQEDRLWWGDMNKFFGDLSEAVRRQWCPREPGHFRGPTLVNIRYPYWRPPNFSLHNYAGYGGSRRAWNPPDDADNGSPSEPSEPSWPPARGRRRF